MYYLSSVRANLGRLRRDENALWSFGPHDLSMIDVLVPGAPVTIAARGASYLQPGIADVVFVNLGQVRPDENALWSFGPHDVSVALYVLGEEPVRVVAYGKSYLQPGIEDVVFLVMEFKSGALAHVQMSWLDPHKERRLTIVGSRRMVVFDDMQPREKLKIYDKGIDRPPEYQSYGESLTLREGDISIPRLASVEPLMVELRHFVAVAQRREAPRADAASGVAVVRVLAAASRSLASGGQPVVL